MQSRARRRLLFAKSNGPRQRPTAAVPEDGRSVLMIFTEPSSPPEWLWYAASALAVVGVALSLSGIIFDVPLGNRILLVGVGTSVVVAGQLIRNAVISIEVSSAGVSCRFGRLWRATLSPSDVTRWEVVQLSAASVGGIGLRWLPNTRALLYSSGPGISITTSGGLTLLVRTDRADEACEAIGRCVRSDSA